jgi:tRNA(adenine34) deaminase
MSGEARVHDSIKLWATFESIDHESFMREALAEAEAALAAGDLPIGSVIVCEGTVVARGRNRIRSDSSQLAHAEMVALRNGGDLLFRRFEECIIYTTREPCIMCLGAIAMADVRHVVYGATDMGRGGTDMYTNVAYVRSQIHRYIGGVLAHECQVMFDRQSRET